MRKMVLRCSHGKGDGFVTRACGLRFKKAFLSFSRRRFRSPASREGDGCRWEEVERWLAFSDLHVSRKTIGTCIEVLQMVKKEAESRRAGVLFLGDFWHARGALPVEPLNEVLEVFKSWTVPTIMISGNHDQVTIGGDVHALKPIEAASDFVRVVDRPTEFLGALFLPYRRNGAEVEEYIRSAGDAKAVFAHIDVAGAQINEKFQKLDGMSPSSFPPGLPVYTGHYHNPHIVEGTTITYIGSPYQVSWGEAGQQKFLWLLDRSFNVEGRIPLDIGPRHFVLKDGESYPDNLRKGDLLRVQLDNLSEPSETLNTLMERGVHVEVVQAFPESPPRIEQAELLGPQGLYHTFAQAVEMSSDARIKGLEFLESASHADTNVSGQRRKIEFDSIVLDGYGPFSSRMEYSFANRSIRIVTGRNEDDPGCLSNGAGKTALVMSPMWALTGSTEPRILGGLKATSLTNAEVVNDNCSYAYAELVGLINGRKFLLKRKVGRRTLKLLQFIYDGEDMTCQEAKLTQKRIDDLFNIDVLTKIIFHGQHTVEQLLGSNDKEFKDELGKLVGIDIWESAKSISYAELRQAKLDIEALNTELHIREGNGDHLRSKIAQAMEDNRKWMEQSKLQHLSHDRLLGTAREQLKEVAEKVNTTLAYCCRLIREIGHDDDPLYDSDSICTESMLSLVAKLEAEVQKQEDEIVKHRIRLGSLQSTSNDYMRQLDTLDHIHAQGDSPICTQCLQPIPSAAFEHAFETLKSKAEKAERAAEDAIQLLNDLKGRSSVSKSELLQRRKDLGEKEEHIRRMERESRKRQLARQQQELSVQFEIERGEELLRSMGLFMDDLHENLLSPFTSEVGLDGAIELLRPLLDQLDAKRRNVENLERDMQLYLRSRNPHTEKIDSLQGLLAEEQERIASIREIQAKKERELCILREVDASFSRTGIQSFLLEGVLLELQSKTSKFLNELSSGTLRLTLSATRQAKTKQGTQVERIDKSVQVLSGGKFMERSIKSLSGGEQRRVALALSLAFSELASERSNTRVGVLVLDEPFQHLDIEGCQRATSLLKSLHFETILLVSQAHDVGTSSIDQMDCVVKTAKGSFIESES